MTEEENGKITRTQLGPGDDGPGRDSFWLTIEGPGWGQGFGGYGLEGAFTDYAIRGILMATGANCWEKLVGRYVRIRREGGLIRAIGNIDNDPLRTRVEKDGWFIPATFYDAVATTEVLPSSLPLPE